MMKKKLEIFIQEDGEVNNYNFLSSILQSYFFNFNNFDILAVFKNDFSGLFASKFKSTPFILIKSILFNFNTSSIK